MRSSWGSLTYDPKRKVGRIRYWAETDKGYRRCSKTVRGTRKECEEARAQLMLDHSQDAPCPTVGQVWERWVLPELERRNSDGELSDNSLKMYRSNWGRHVEDRWAWIPCDSVTALDVQQWLLDGKTHSQADCGRRILSFCLEKAALYGSTQSNVMRLSYQMPAKSTVKRMDKGVWNLSQLGEVWRLVHGRFYEAAFILSAFGGCRVGESLGPLSSEVGCREVGGVTVATVPIMRQVPNRGTEATDRLKNRQSRRTVVIAGKAAVELLRIAGDNPGTYLTNDGCGSCVPQNTLGYNWAKDVPDGMRHPYRNLRNSWQTNMRWELGLPPWLIEPMMGHAGQGVTGQYYDRPQVDVFCEVLAKAYAENPYDAAWTWLEE